jgi:hypothetical protein
MATPPRFYGPDGVLRQEYTFSTTRSTRIFTGEMDPDTVDMQVSIRGAGFTSDPDLVAFEGSSFIIPNPNAFTDGLQLFPGSNRIEVKSILTNGDATSVGVIIANLSLEGDLGVITSSPTDIQAERLNRTVNLSIRGLSDENVTGYNFYAATETGGGVFGYSLLNVTPIVSSETEEEVDELGDLEVDAEIVTNSDGTAAADPLFYVVAGSQQDNFAAVLQDDFNEAIEVPEDVTQVRTSLVLQSVIRVEFFSFVHDRRASYEDPLNPAIPNAQFNTVLESDPLYYVVTAVYLVDGVEVESEFSQEIAASPLIITPNVGTFPTVSQQQIIRDTTLSIHRTQPQVDVKPGSVVRDTFTDPFKTEASRFRFVVDFLHNAMSFSTLLPIDDPTLTGQSIPVAQSAYKIAIKQAFFIVSEEAVQQLIDDCFDKLASNYGVTRRGGRRSRGEVTFYVKNTPTETTLLPIGTIVGGGAANFRTTSSARIDVNGAGTIFNAVTGRYSVRAFIQAEEPGTAGNLAVGQINTVVQGPGGVFVTNEARTFGGTNEESNRDLSIRAQGTLSGVDSGTRQGLVQRSRDVPSLRQVSVIAADDPLMFRDYDETIDKHLGGMVDIWIRGENVTATVTDAFAFEFEMAEGIQFEVVGDPQDLVFRAIDPTLSEDSPIIEMLDYEDIGLGLKNITKGTFFDLTNATILVPDKVQLDSSLNDPATIAVTDVFQGDYRYRTSSKYVLPRQPVLEVLSLTGSVSGTIDPTIVFLYHPQSPLILGRSIEAGDYVQVIQPVDEAAALGSIPSGDPVVVTDELHVLLDGVEYLNNLGINPLTVAVYNLDRSVEYIGPYNPAVTTGTTPDYLITEGDATTPLAISINPAASALTAGVSVLVDYWHDENFSVEYRVDTLVAVAQDHIENVKHVDADILYKSAIEVEVDIAGTIVLRVGASSSDVDARLRTDLENFFDALVLGEPVRQSDIIKVLEDDVDVSYVVVPLTTLVKADGAPIIREPLPTTREGVTFIQIDNWSTNLVTTWLLTTPLETATADAGGPVTEFRGVFSDVHQFTHMETAPNFNGDPIRNATNNAFIIGNGGLEIPGYNDDATLKLQEPFATDEQIAARQIELSANRVLITLAPDDTPVDHSITVTYVAEGDSGVKNIEVNPVEYLVLNDFDGTYDEDHDFTTRQTNRAQGR